ncbi:MAG TPA: hypothetical protein VM120_24740 [Bryobacteraceae bacterium]|nr:hypothetical protein [Bryobacteraceae bacterium]
MIVVAMVILLAHQGETAGGLAAVRAEPNPERRYWKALEYAVTEIQDARKSYHDGKSDAFHAAIGQVGAAVQLCDETLRSTGKNPSRNPKHFKRAELKIREILRRMAALENEAAVEDRPFVAKVRTDVQELHDELLMDIMGRRR